MNNVFVPLDTGSTMVLSRPRVISPFCGHPIDHIPIEFKFDIMVLKATKKLQAYYDNNQNIDIELVIGYFAECFESCTDPEKKRYIIEIILFLCQRRSILREYNERNNMYLN